MASRGLVTTAVLAAVVDLAEEALIVVLAAAEVDHGR